MSEQNKILERTLIEEVWNRGNLALIDKLVSADFRGHSSSPETDTRGTEGYRQYYVGLRTAFPDIHFSIEDQIAEGDRVVTRWTARGTHQAEYAGVPATGREGVIAGVTTDRIADGRSVECWTSVDELGLLRQLGVLPAAGQAA